MVDNISKISKITDRGSYPMASSNGPFKRFPVAEWTMKIQASILWLFVATNLDEKFTHMQHWFDLIGCWNGNDFFSVDVHTNYPRRCTLPPATDRARPTYTCRGRRIAKTRVTPGHRGHLLSYRPRRPTKGQPAFIQARDSTGRTTRAPTGGPRGDKTLAHRPIFCRCA